MPLSREAMRDYQAKRRAAIRDENPVEPRRRSKIAERRYVPPEGTHSSYQYLPGDHLIGEMTQHQRDHILARMPKTARER